MTFWCGSGSAEPCLWLMDPDFGSGSCYFRHWPSGRQQKNHLKKSFPAYYFLKVQFHHFLKIKSPTEVTNSRNQSKSYYFCLMIEGSGSIPLTNGSGSGRPKNMRIWIRIRIRNTVCSESSHTLSSSVSMVSPSMMTDWRRMVEWVSASTPSSPYSLQAYHLEIYY